MSSNIFDRLSFLSLFLVIVLLPLFVLPFTSFPVEISKIALLVVGLGLAVVFWAIARFFDGRITLPKSWLLISGGGIVIASLLSALMSANSQVSFFGTMFDVGSFWFIFAGFFVMFMSAMIFRNPVQAKLTLLGVIFSSVVVLIFQTAHVFFPEFLSMGVLVGKTGNLIGSWNALGLFAGFASLMFLLQLEFFPVSRMGRVALQLFILLSVLVAAAVNFPLVWILLGISALIIFVYKASSSLLKSEGENQKKDFPAMSLILVLVSLLFFISAQFIGNLIPNLLQISNSEIGPSFSSTMWTTKSVLMKDPVFGMGPNRFADAWALYKPASVNNTLFWDTAFSFGSGLLPTLTATTGILGILSWIVFLVLFLVIGVRSVFSGLKNKATWEMMAFFVLSLYLFISMFLYPTGAVIFLLALAFTGIYVGLKSSGEGKEIQISFLNDHRKSFFSILSLILVIIFAFGATFKFIEKFTSIVYFGRALSASEMPLAEQSINKAISLYTNDLYLRTYSQIYLVKLNSLAQKGENLSEQEKADLQNSFDRAVQSAQEAVRYNPTNYLNYRLLGSVYQTVGAMGVKGAYANAEEAFKKASELNPLNPGLKLAIADAALADGRTKDASDNALAALELKPDNVDTLLFLSQLAKKQGNNTEALSYARKALELYPADQNLINYVNSLSGTSASAPASLDTSAKEE